MSELRDQIIALTDQDALVSCRSLIVLLNLKLINEPDANLPSNVNPANLDGIVKMSGQATADLQSSLANAGNVEAAAAARGLLTLCADMGYEDEVRQACKAAGVHVRDMGIISGPLVVAAVAAIIAWVPKEKKKMVKTQTVTTSDGTTITTEETFEEVHRVGAAALGALKSWWERVIPV